MAEGEADSATVIGSFLDRAAQRGSQPLWYHQTGGRWLAVSWASARSEVLRLAAGLASLGIGPGERVGLVVFLIGLPAGFRGPNNSLGFVVLRHNGLAT